MYKQSALRAIVVAGTCVLVASSGPLSVLADQSAPPNPVVTGAPAIVVRMVGSAFVPDSVTLRIGQLVKFENDDDIGHTVTASDGSFDSGYLAKGDRWQIAFDVSRTLSFTDIYHPSMRGTITILVN